MGEWRCDKRRLVQHKGDALLVWHNALWTKAGFGCPDTKTELDAKQRCAGVCCFFVEGGFLFWDTVQDVD